MLVPSRVALSWIGTASKDSPVFAAELEIHESKVLTFVPDSLPASYVELKGTVDLIFAILNSPGVE